MRHFTLTGELLDVVMTTETERIGFLDQQFFDFGIVRIMAAHAALFGRHVAEFQRHELGKILMTVQAKGVHGPFKGSRIFGVLVFVANTAITILEGAV